MTDVRDPICGVRFAEDQAEALGAFVVVRGGKKHYLCSSTCRDAFVHAAEGPPG